jgi:hypothetical protein
VTILRTLWVVGALELSLLLASSAGISVPGDFGVREAFASGTPVTAATDEQKQAAQQAFTAALDKAKLGQHEEALAGFRASHDIVASPNSRLMIARELAALKRFGEAYREAVIAERLAKEAAAVDPKYQDAVKGATEDLKEFRAQVGFVKLDLRGIEDSEVVIGGRTITKEEKPEPIAVDPGDVDVVVRSPRGQETRKVNVAAGAEASVSFVDEAAPPPKDEPKPDDTKSIHPFDMGDGQRITGTVAGGVGVVGMVLFGVFGGLHLSKYNDLEDQCPGGQCPASLEEEADTGRTYQTAANVSLVIGAVGLVAGAALLIPTYVIDDSGPNKSALKLQVGPGGFSVQGSFQ